MKKVLSCLLIMTLLVTIFTGCGKKPVSEEPGGSDKGKATGTPAQKEEDSVKKPEKITVMVDGTFFTEQNGQKEWIAKYEELMGVKIDIIQPDHSAFYDVLNQTIASGEWPDVVLLNPTYYASYAAEGVLWDMAEALEKSGIKENLSPSDLAVVDGMYLNGKLYGMTRERGNGCVTFMKKAWLHKVNLKAPTNYEEYLKVCEAFATGDPDGNGVNGDTYATSAAGFLSPETPYVNYLPEFYQDAYPTFYKKADGTWVDGFTEDAMVGALERLRDAYQKGYIDPETLTNATSDVRNKFYEDRTGIFTYWAGKWATNLKTNLEANGIDSELIAIEPIAEVGTYIDRATGGYCITTKSKNPEGVFKYFIEPMFNNVDVQALWAYGVEGVHWSTAAETILGVTYEEGQLHGLISREKPDTAYTFNSSYLRVGMSEEFITKYNAVEPEEAKKSQVMFNDNSRQEERIFATTEMAQYNGDLITLKREIIANVVTQGKSIEDEMKRFEAEGGLEWSNSITNSLNAANN